MSVIHITTPEQFVQVFNSSSAIGSSSDYAEIYLDNDIDFEGYLEEHSITSWVGRYNYRDYYYFDGQGHSVKNLVVYDMNNSVQLFVCCENSYIKNLVLDNCHFTVNKNDNTGMFRYDRTGTITNTEPCFSNIIIKGNCSFININTNSSATVFAFAIHEGQNILKCSMSRIGISGTFKSPTVRNLRLQGYSLVQNAYINSVIECNYGYGAFCDTNYGADRYLINVWNRSKVKANNEYHGLCNAYGQAYGIYCYSSLTDDGSTGTIYPITSANAKLYECLYTAEATSGIGELITVSDLQNAAYLRNRGWLI